MKNGSATFFFVSSEKFFLANHNTPDVSARQES